MTRTLFVCIQNAGRSQMAQAFATAEGLAARSAGSAPADHVHPEVADAMREVGIDISNNTPRRLTEDDVQWADVVVTMGCGDACPYVPATTYIDWDLDDPHGMDAADVRAVRDEIRRRVAQLAHDNANATPGGPA